MAASKICKLMSQAKRSPQEGADLAGELLKHGKESKDIRNAIFYAASLLSEEKLQTAIFKQIFN